MMYRHINASRAFHGLYSHEHITLGCLHPRFGHMLVFDSLIFLSLLAKLVPGPIVEFGTFTGRTTYNMAINTRQQIYTIDIGSGGDEEYEKYVVGEAFTDKNIPNIHYLIGDSRTVPIPVEPHTAGLVIIDGGHSYDVVKSDSRRAFDLIRSDGIIVWDDYHASWPGVLKAVNELADTHTLIHLELEGFVVYCPTLVIDSAPEKV
jgi:predicted O-methyltransferase YrrM